MQRATDQSRGESMDTQKHIEFSKQALRTFQELSGSGDEHSIADLICDLGHLADQQGVNFLQEIERGVGHWHAERSRSHDLAASGQPHVQIRVRPRK
jgi:hypothetical protein